MKAKVIWISIIVAILGIPVIFYGIMFVLVQVNPVSIEANYSENAANWDEIRKQEQAGLALQWTMDLQALPGDQPDQVDITVTLFDKYGKPIGEATVDVIIFHNAQASRKIEQSLTNKGDGTYQTTLPMRRSGLWEFEVTATKGDDLFKETIRKNVIIPTRK